MGIRTATLLSFAPAFFALAAGGCGLVLDLEPPAQGSDASVPYDGSQGRMDATVEPDAARPPADGGNEDGGRWLDASRPVDAGPAEVDASPALDGGACRALPTDACEIDSDCSGGEVCAKPVGDCMGPGTCRPPTPAASCGSLTVCGCNQRTYANVCAAERDGMSILSTGACPTVPVGGDWCPGDLAPSRANLPCGTVLVPCFDDADCGGFFFPYCIGSSGCSAGDEGVCLDQSDSLCFRDDVCADGQRCLGAAIRSIDPVEGRCNFP